MISKIRNETFFKNAKDSNVIRVSEDVLENLSVINFSKRTHILKDLAEND